MRTLGDGIDLFHLEMTGQISESTQRNYRFALGCLCRHLGDGVDCTAVTRSDLIAWRSCLAARYAVETANMYIRVARRFFRWFCDRWGEETGTALKNPARGLKQIKPTAPAEPKAVDPDDALRLMAAAYADNDLRNQAIVTFLYVTGGRVGGLINLRLGDLELERNRAWVVEKGNKGRYVYLPDAARETLENYIRYHRPRLEGVDHVFISQRRRPLSRHGVWHVLRTLAKRAGVTGVHNPHSFRHAFAIAYLQNGGDLSSLSRLLGHSSIAITHANYGRWSEDQLQEQHGRFGPQLPRPGDDETRNFTGVKRQARKNP